MNSNRRLPTLFGTVIGLVGFGFGLFGPQLFGPDYPQVPAAVLTTPWGIAIGVLLGKRLTRKAASTLIVVSTLLGSSIVMAAFSLLLSIPPDKQLDLIVSAEILSCEPKSTSEGEGLVLKVKVLSANYIYMSKKPWNYGAVTSVLDSPVGYKRRCFVPNVRASCGDYKVGAVAYYSLDWAHAVSFPRESPEDTVYIPLLQPAPGEYQQLVMKDGK